MKTMQTLRSQTGINIIEIMIALLVGAFLIGGLMQMFISTKKTYNMQDANSRIQENGRFAIEFLSQDIHNADFWGCLILSTSSNDGIYNLNALPALDPAYNNPNNLGVAGIDNDNSVATIVDGTDSIVLTGFRNSGVPVVADGINGTTPLTIVSGTGKDLKKNNWVAVSDCENADVFQIANDIGNSTSVAHAADFAGRTYGRTAQIFPLYRVTYEIRASTSVNGLRSLYRKINDDPAQELIEGIRDMQILYGEDTDADGLPNRYYPADQVNMVNVKGVRISLLAESVADGLMSDTNPKTLSYASGSGTAGDDGMSKTFKTCPKGTQAKCSSGDVYDGRVRNIYDVTLAIRNRLK